MLRRGQEGMREAATGNDRGLTAGLPPVSLLRSLYAEIVRSMSADVSPGMRRRVLPPELVLTKQTATAQKRSDSLARSGANSP